MGRSDGQVGTLIKYNCGGIPPELGVTRGDTSAPSRAYGGVSPNIAPENTQKMHVLGIGCRRLASVS